MKFSRTLQDFSLPEAFKLISEGKKSGLLSLRIFDESLSAFKKHYISVKDGVITGFFENFDGRDLITWLTSNPDLLSFEQRRQVMRINYNLQEYTSLGDYLVAKQILDASQLQAVFKTQVAQPICRLLQNTNGLFTFNDNADVPVTELTGLHITIPELIISGLHQLADWSIFTDKLPEPQAALLQVSPVSTEYRKILHPIEKQLIDTANGCLSFMQLARQWGYEMKQLQRAAFCLVVTGLLEELPIANTNCSSQRASTTPIGAAMPAGIAQTQREYAPIPTLNPSLAIAELQHRASLTQPQLIANIVSHQISADSLSPSGINSVGMLPHPQPLELPEPESPSPSVQPPSHGFLDKLSNFFNQRIAFHRDDVMTNECISH